MSAEVERDLQHCHDELGAARQQLLAGVSALRDADLEKALRGGWSVRRVLEHVAYSEWAYSRVITHLRGLPVPDEAFDATLSSAGDAAEKLDASRQALVTSLDGVNEESFYRLGRLGHEEYSILSVLENEINHEREHAEQVQAIVAG